MKNNEVDIEISFGEDNTMTIMNYGDVDFTLQISDGDKFIIRTPPNDHTTISHDDLDKYKIENGEKT